MRGIKDIDSFSIETRTNDYTGETEFYVYGWGIYPEYSVLAGQSRKVFIDSFDTIEEAYEAYPEARPGCASACSDDESLADLSGLPENPPSWFNPMDAGENWSDDY